MSMIKEILAREVLDSRGFPTVEADVLLSSGEIGRGTVPSGASTGSKEALERRDKDPKRYLGKGVQHAVQSIVQTISPALKGKNVLDQSEVDATLIALDGTANKEKLGANALLAVSMACARAAAQAKKEPLYQYLSQLGKSALSLPVPMLNILNGGAHADNSIDIQEFMILPCGAPDFAQSLRYGVEVYHCLKSVLKEKGLNTNVGDEGGFAPSLASNEAALEMITLAIEKAGFIPGKDIYLGLDIAASEFYRNGKYVLASENRELTSLEFIELLQKWVSRYPIISIEDAMDENDWEGWKAITGVLGNQLQLVGDDLFVTNTKIFKEGIEHNMANAILIKLNQIGTLTETLSAIHLAKASNYNVIVSHRSGETEDAFIADLAVGLDVKQIKTGAPCRSDRTAKYNQLLRIMQQSQAPFAGLEAFSRWINA